VTSKRIVRGLAVLCAAAALLGACGGDDGGASGSDADTEEAEGAATEETTTTEAEVDAEAEEAAVSDVLTEFFSLVGQGDFEAASALIENGEAAVPRLVHCADLVSGVTIEMSSVELVDDETASALFAILKDGAVLLAESGGGAVKVDGEWLVSENTFLSLYDAAKEGCTGPPPPA
jgi:hypothetical protein